MQAGKGQSGQPDEAFGLAGLKLHNHLTLRAVQATIAIAEGSSTRGHLRTRGEIVRGGLPLTVFGDDVTATVVRRRAPLTNGAFLIDALLAIDGQFGINRRRAATNDKQPKEKEAGDVDTGRVHDRRSSLS